MRKTGEQLRDEGIDLVLSHTKEEYKIKYRKKALCKKTGSLFEDIRLELEDEGFFAKPQACGGMANGIIKDGLARYTGEWRKSKDPRSHARSQRVYVVIHR